ncbi:MAG: hypothetical protein GY795_00140, partial [Desulfobacterales bacterium]|nr:hypothetical protein [Desulfobacterales bacterium]
MKRPELADKQDNTLFLLRFFILITVAAILLRLEQCPFMNIRVCILPVCYVFLLWTALRLAAKGTDAPVISVLIFGIFFIAGGAVFDLSSTIVSSPDLEREGNVYIRHLLDSGHSLAFAYFYLFLGIILTDGSDIVLLIALLKNRSLIASKIVLSKNRSSTVSNTDVYFHIFWLIAILNISSDIKHWMDGIGWHGIILYQITRESVRMGCLYFCLSLYTVLLWETYRQLYQPELKAEFRLCAVSVYIFIITASTLFYVRSHVNKINLSCLDDIISYAAENNLMNRYAEIDDAIQKITSNPYIGKKQTNGADALSEYCSPDTEERREEFVISVKKTADMLDFS